MSSLDDDLALAQAMADAADALTMSRFLASDLVVETKPDLTPVSDADRDVEQMVRATLAAQRPHDEVLGEEFGGATDAAVHGRRWIIDPVDGTKNFVRGVPVWATLIALAVDGDVTLGVVSAPALRRRWWAASSCGAWTTFDAGTPRALRVSAVAHLDDASLSFSDEIGWGDRDEAFAELRAKVWRTRAYGDFWSHVLVAEGAVDIAIEPDLSLWDIAALIPVIQEAGGTVTALGGESALTGGSAVSTNGVLHAEALTALTPR